MAGFLRSARGGVSPCLPHPSHDSQVSRLAIAITSPVTHAARTENSRRSPRSVGISRLPYTSPVHVHLGIPKVWPSFDARLTKRHELFHGSRRM